MSQYYVYNGICPSKPAYELYAEYIKAADGYCNDELQEENDGTWTIFTELDYHDWIDYHYDLRFIKQGKRIVKSFLRTAREYLDYMSDKENHELLANSDSMFEDDDEVVLREADLFCKENDDADDILTYDSE